MLRILRTVGKDKLEKVIEVSGSSKQSELKATVARLMKRIH